MSTRDRMLDAAARVMRTRGLARAATKEIAKGAGFSEAALYKHFQDKTDLFLGVLPERAPNDLMTLLTALPDRAGTGELRRNLVEVTAVATGFYADTFPIAASLFSEPSLLEAHRNALRERDAGPQLVREALTLPRRRAASRRARPARGPGRRGEPAARFLLPVGVLRPLRRAVQPRPGISGRDPPGEPGARGLTAKTRTPPTARPVENR
ncbi:hypothetical protein GCM10009854_25480 [Saccharopolyspora halophila]|uniref:HTH tetR-type domain-containing protein n=1 Tax=Saccharopolyspora halophila TaxID=405551 RepID=A0ABN3GA30_9PSEU